MYNIDNKDNIYIYINMYKIDNIDNTYNICNKYVEYIIYKILYIYFFVHWIYVIF